MIGLKGQHSPIRIRLVAQRDVKSFVTQPCFQLGPRDRPVVKRLFSRKDFELVNLIQHAIGPAGVQNIHLVAGGLKDKRHWPCNRPHLGQELRGRDDGNDLTFFADQPWKKLVERGGWFLRAVQPRKVPEGQLCIALFLAQSGPDHLYI